MCEIEPDVVREIVKENEALQEKLKNACRYRDEGCEQLEQRAEQAEAENEALRGVLEKAENFLLGLHLDPAIPDHIRDDCFVKASDINNALRETSHE